MRDSLSEMAARRSCSTCPVEVYPACGQVWLTMPVAKQLDVLFDKLLASGAETAQVHWDQAVAG